jgi:hypothetical protein
MFTGSNRSAEGLERRQVSDLVEPPVEQEGRGREEESEEGWVRQIKEGENVRLG